MVKKRSAHRSAASLTFAECHAVALGNAMQLERVLTPQVTWPMIGMMAAILLSRASWVMHAHCGQAHCEVCRKYDPEAYTREAHAMLDECLAQMRLLMSDAQGAA